nr:hypothetical protein [Tanacetum cinerariifolium]
MSVLRNHNGLKTKHFKGMTLEEIKAKFDPVWRRIQDFIPIGSKEESKRFKRKGIRPTTSDKEMELWVELKRLYKPDVEDQLWTHTQSIMHAPVEWKLYDTCRVHHVTSKDKEIFMLMEKLNKMHKAFPLPVIEFPLPGEVPTASEESSYCQKKIDASAKKIALLLKLSSNYQSKSYDSYANDKEMELWVELKRLYKPDVKDQLWTHTQSIMHAPVEWKLYDTCRVHHVTSKDKEIFMLVEKDYPLKKGLFWNFVYKHHDFYRIKIDKKKRFKLTLEVLRDIFQICPRIADQDFDVLPSEEDTISFLKELGHTGVINLLIDVPYLPRLPGNLRKRLHPRKIVCQYQQMENLSRKAKRVKRSSKKSSTTPTTSIVIREPPVETQLKRKEKVDVARGKGIDLLCEVALTKEVRMKEVIKKSLRDFHKSHPSGSSSVAEKPPSVEKITPSVTSEGTDDTNNKEGSEQENHSEGHESDSEQDTDGSESNSKSDQQDDNDEVNDDDDDDEDDDNDDDKSEGNKDIGMDSDDVQDEKADLPHILPEEVSNFAPPVIEKMIQESLNQVNLAKASPQPQSSYEVDAALTEFELKKIIINKMNSSESYLIALEHQECYDGLIKSYNLDKDFFSSYDVYPLKRSRDDTDKDEGPSAGSDQGLKKRKTSKDAEPTTKEPEFKVRALTRLKALSEMLDWENPECGDYPFDLSKPLPLITRGNRQSVSVEFFINNDLKDQCKTFYAYARGIQSRRDVYSTERILTVTHVSVMKKHGYGYLEEIVVRRADNALYKLKEGDFLRLRINDIKDMLLLVVQNRLTNLLGDDVANFAITFRMFTKSLVIQKRVEDLQLGVESYQKHINITKLVTTRPNLRKRHPYTPYKNPQGFIYVDGYQRNRLMRSNELYKFNDGTLTWLLSFLEDITKNIDIKYLPKRRWSTLEKKRAQYMIRYINKLLKERRMMRILEKFVGDRLYGNDLRLLQRAI